MAETIPLPQTATNTASAELSRPAPLKPLLVGADVAGPLCGRSEASWWRDHSAGRCPRPIKLGGRTLWRVEELRRWIEAGRPDRKTWEAREAARNGNASTGRPRASC